MRPSGRRPTRWPSWCAWPGAGRVIERPVLPLPDFIGRIQAALMALMPGEPLMSADNLDSMKRPNVASEALPTLAALDIPPTALEAVGPAYLAPVRGRGRLGQWRAHAGR